VVQIGGEARLLVGTEAEAGERRHALHLLAGDGHLA
jgi:hypothetical protein